MQINEIFSSIDGEGIRTGYPVTFIRTFACNLRCTYCDTLYAVAPETEEDLANAFTVMTIPEILARCEELKNKRITFTGGEPLIQRDAAELVAALLDNGYEVSIETNGAVELESFENELVSLLQNDEALNNLIYTLDYKCPTSGMEDKMIMSNLNFLIDGDVLKFVVGSTEDLDRMKAVLEEYTPQGEIFVSPVFGNIEPAEIVDYILANDMQNVRVQLQLHKLIWDPATRGV